MQAVQEGQIRLDGDYKLIIWFASLAKQAIKLSDNHQQKLDIAKGYLNKAQGWLNTALKTNKK